MAMKRRLRMCMTVWRIELNKMLQAREYRVNLMLKAVANRRARQTVAKWRG